MGFKLAYSFLGTNISKLVLLIISFILYILSIIFLSDLKLIHLFRKYILILLCFRYLMDVFNSDIIVSFNN